MYTDLKNTLSKPFVPKTAFIILAVFVVWLIIDGVISILEIHHAHGPVALPLPPKSIPLPTHTEVSKATFFGEYVPEHLEGSNIKQSRLNLTVVGVVYAEDEARSQVIIRSANGQEQVYQVGDQLPGGGIIKRITPNGVLVSRQGSLESLSLPKNELIFAPVAKPLIGD
ncbi:type II secretion system protein N [Legionella impletisoli]|uniref:General secretion pathway protein GspC n=1 Tax=Legionella impletisoli TaxID=343510 RepID=A0A917JQC4_9GAMM|nr:type II secretion system protein N [Legionella impletisoli]GGI81226.1 general secretion pathway protein GspC [Legionella impletisoli]